MAKYGGKAQRKVKRAMHKRKAGTLRSGRSGRKVTSREQAIAIGLSEARKSGARVPKEKKKASCDGCGVSAPGHAVIHSSSWSAPESSNARSKRCLISRGRGALRSDWYRRAVIGDSSFGWSSNGTAEPPFQPGLPDFLSRAGTFRPSQGRVP